MTRKIGTIKTNEFTQYQYWTHKPSGDVFAVCLISGQPKWTNGPLHHTDVRQYEPYEYNFDDTFAGDVDDFVPT